MKQPKQRKQPKQLFLIGTGMNPVDLPPQARAAIAGAEVLLGAPRMTAPYADQGKPVYPIYQTEQAAAFLIKSEAASFAFLVSGDTGFYSAATLLARHLEKQCPSAFVIRFFPGISALSYFFAALGRPWQEAALVSLHGSGQGIAGQDIIGQVRRHKLTFCLTGGNCREVGEKLTKAGYGALTVYAGENLGYPEESLRTTTAAAMAGQDWAALTVLLIENPQGDARCPVGLPDAAFIRGEVPMTKSEVRAIVMAKLQLFPGAICYDIGTGTGSVAVEMGLSAYDGQVYALDGREKALALLEQNLGRFHLGNVQPVLGQAPEAFLPLPAPDAVFIGGSSGRLGEIVPLLLEKNPAIRLVTNAVTLESAHEALQAMTTAGLAGVEAIQVAITRTKAVAGRHLLQAQNPIFIISGGGSSDSDSSSGDSGSGDSQAGTLPGPDGEDALSPGQNQGGNQGENQAQDLGESQEGSRYA